MLRVLALLLALPATASADAVRTPAPRTDCPVGSVSATSGLHHGNFAYCAVQACVSDAACAGRLRCREVALEIRERIYTTGGHGAPSAPQHVSEVVGPCDAPEPGLTAVDTSLAGSILGRGPDVPAGCRRVQACAPPGRGDPLGTTPAPAPAPPEVPPPAEAPETPAPIEPPAAVTVTVTETESEAPAATPPDTEPPPARGCACRAGAANGASAWLLAAALVTGLVARRR